jgi:hypothetical protein
MVYEPGGYNFMDYIKLGLPLQIVCGIFTVVIVFSLDYWWVYAVVLAVLSPLAIGIFFLFKCNKPHKFQLEDDATEAAFPDKALDSDKLAEAGKGVEVVSVRCDEGDNAPRT